MILAAFTALKMQSISKAWEFIFSMGAGIGLVLILRWFWWRINAWSEITALATSILITISLELIAWNQTVSAGNQYSLFGTAPVLFGITLQVHHKLMIIVPLAIIAWVSATFLTSPEPIGHLKVFYERVQPGGWWAPVTKGFEHTAQPVSKGILIQWFAGILNGTTNFILSKMSENQSSFKDALKEAQDLGLAEADPTMDVDGTDAAQKASILSALAFNTLYDFNSVSYEGIENVSPEDIVYAEQLEYSVKHIAYGSIVDGDVNVSAFPTFVPKGQLLSQVDNK